MGTHGDSQETHFFLSSCPDTRPNTRPPGVGSKSLERSHICNLHVPKVIMSSAGSSAASVLLFIFIYPWQSVVGVYKKTTTLQCEISVESTSV